MLIVWKGSQDFTQCLYALILKRETVHGPLNTLHEIKIGGHFWIFLKLHPKLCKFIEV